MILVTIRTFPKVAHLTRDMPSCRSSVNWRRQRCSLSHTIGKRPLPVPRPMGEQNGLTVCGLGGSCYVLGDAGTSTISTDHPSSRQSRRRTSSPSPANGRRDLVSIQTVTRIVGAAMRVARRLVISLTECRPANPRPQCHATPNRAAQSLRSVAASLLKRSISAPIAAAKVGSDAPQPSLRNSCLRCCSVSDETFPFRRSRWSSAMNCPAVLISQ
jgi:hypothetical protein